MLFVLVLRRLVLAVELRPIFIRGRHLLQLQVMQQVYVQVLKRFLFWIIMLVHERKRSISPRHLQ